MAGLTVKNRGIAETERLLDRRQVSGVPRVVNVTDPAYGAVGDGVHDDTAAIQAAINALHSQGFGNISGGGVVFFPATLGKYRLTSALITYPYIRLVGEQSFAFDGSRGSRLWADPAGVFTNGPYSSPYLLKQDGTDFNSYWHGGSVEHLCLDCNSVAGVGAAHFWSMGENTLLEYIRIQNTGVTARAVADAVTNGTTTVTSATSAFTADDVNAVVTGTNIPSNTKIDIVNSATSVTLTNAASGSGSGGSLTINRPAEGIVQEGNAPTGVARSISGSALSGSLVRLKNLGSGSWVMESLSGDAIPGGLLRISHAASNAIPPRVTVVNVKAENSGTWNAQDPVIRMDNCDTLALNVVGGSFLTGFASGDAIRIDQPVTNRAGPSVSLIGIDGQDPFQSAYANIIRDSSTGKAIPSTPLSAGFINGRRLHPNVQWQRDLLIGGGGMIQQPAVALTQAATVTPDASSGPWQTLTVTTNAAVTIAAPPNPPASTNTAELTIEVLNSSGGAMGVITWNAAFVFPTGAWANPASTKKRFARFEWNGVNWICTSLASADY